jgi:molecular chaperone DnaJ
MNEKIIDFYKLLDLEPFADFEKVKAAWKKKAKLHHPDRNPGDDSAALRFDNCNKAYKVLSDPGEREKYDVLYSRKFRRARDTSWKASATHTTRTRARSTDSARPKAATKERPFKRRERRSETSAPLRGRDFRLQISIALKHFYAPGTLRLRLEHLNETIRFKLPVNLSPGEEIALSGKGFPGKNGGSAGNLVLEVQPEMLDGSTIVGPDLKQILELNALQAAVGGKVIYQHPDGRRLQIAIPPGTQDGTTIRLRKQGFKNGSTRGDIICEVMIIVPEIKSSRIRKLIEKALHLLDD